MTTQRDRGRATEDRVHSELRDFIAAVGYSPSLGELASITGLSRRGVHEAMLRLERNGRIYRAPGAARTWRPTNREAAE